MIQTQLSRISIDSDGILDLLESLQKEEPLEHETPPTVPIYSTFIETYDQSNFYQSQPGILSSFLIIFIKFNAYYISVYTSPPSVPVGSSPMEPKAIDSKQ